MASRLGKQLQTLVGRGLLAMRLGASVGLGLALVYPAGVSASSAHAASKITLHETAHLHRTSGHGITINQDLNEQGSASGTISGTIYIHLRVISTNRVSAEVNIYPHGGSITGIASASFRSEGGVASFSGTLAVVRGTGRYNHAHGTGLSFSGTVQRINDAVTVRVAGGMTT